jgi:hypothetical protein
MEKNSDTAPRIVNFRTKWEVTGQFQAPAALSHEISFTLSICNLLNCTVTHMWRHVIG